MVFKLIQWATWLFGRVVTSLRYRVTVVGQERVLAVPGPYLLLPNHPGFADPPNILARLWPAFKMRPMLLETNFRAPGLKQLGAILRAIKVPDVDAGSGSARQEVEAAVAAAVASLKAGDNVILWPSGRVMRDGVERVGGTRTVAEILTAVPNATVVLVRTRGLWGSMLGFAPTAERPKLVLGLLRGFGLILANLFVLVPKRPVTIALEAFATANRPAANRDVLNPWMEAWYNADVNPEPATFVPHHFLFGPRTYEFPPPPSHSGPDPSRVKPATKQAIAEMLAEKLKRPLAPEENAPDVSILQLGLDSLDAMEVNLDVERRFGFTGSAMPLTVGQLWALAEGHTDTGPPKPPPKDWFKPRTGGTDIQSSGKTVAEAILNRVLMNPHDVACADDSSGVLTYERFAIGALILARRFQEIPEPNVGLLLPASAAGMMSLLGLHLAGKLPVVLNWTTGPANMGHGVERTGVKNVITSRRFIDRAQVEVPGAEYVYLEDLRLTVGRFEKLWRLLAMKLARGNVIRAALAKLNSDPDRPAVVLFTSGSEKAPKAVPLTHTNVVENMRSGAPALGLDRNDSILVFLPLFHSFGHTVTGVFPLFGGVKVVYHPDPTDATGLVRKVALYKPTALAATPTFFGYMLDRAKPGELDSLAIVVVGAEKCPEAIFEKAKLLAPNAVVAEGYGITECSPVVTVTPAAAPKPGTIGKPIAGVELRVVDPETEAPLPAGSRGLLLVSGPTVFDGYIGEEGPPPFRELDGKRWYVTGDLAEVGADGYVRFHGRLKRFLKVAGEMISLPALEEPFAKKYPPTDAGPRVAVEGIETPDGRRIVLFSTESITLKEANAQLAAEGFRGILRLDDVQKIDAIPVLGTGKTDYKVLRAKIESSSPIKTGDTR